jgi:hypothetical protein
MFWQAPSPERSSAKREWRSRLRRAVDLAVAFATLEDITEDRDGAFTAPGHPGAPGPYDHPHRVPLRAAQRSRRPGTVAARVQPCTSPLAPPATGRRTRARGGVSRDHVGR